MAARRSSECVPHARPDAENGNVMGRAYAVMERATTHLEPPVIAVLVRPCDGEPLQFGIVDDLFGDTLEDHVSSGRDVVRPGDHGAVGIGPQIALLLLTDAGAEVEDTVVDHTDDRSQMRSPAGPHGGDPVDLGGAQTGDGVDPRHGHDIWVAVTDVGFGSWWQGHENSSSGR